MRKPQVTRSMTNTKAQVMLCNITTATVETQEVTVARTYKDIAKLLKAVKETIETDTLKVVQVISSEEVVIMYGMSEQDFIKYATILDPATRKALETSDEEVEELDEELL